MNEITPEQLAEIEARATKAEMAYYASEEIAVLGKGAGYCTDYIQDGPRDVRTLIAALRPAWAENERLAAELAEAQALIARLERYVRVGNSA